MMRTDRKIISAHHTGWGLPEPSLPALILSHGPLQTSRLAACDAKQVPFAWLDARARAPARALACVRRC